MFYGPLAALLTACGTDARMEITHLTRRPTRYSAGGRKGTPEAGTRLPGAGSGPIGNFASEISPSVPRLPRAPHLIPHLKTPHERAPQKDEVMTL